MLIFRFFKHAKKALALLSKRQCRSNRINY